MRALETHVIKKYANRKLYDTFSRRYVTLEVIAELLRDGHEVRVVDRTSGEDITAVTLSQILLDLERQRRGPAEEQEPPRGRVDLQGLRVGAGRRKLVDALGRGRQVEFLQRLAAQRHSASVPSRGNGAKGTGV